MNNEYILKRIEKDRPFKTEKECIEYYMDECWLKQDVASDLFYYKVIIDKAIEYINRNTCTNVEERYNSIYLYDEYLNNLLDILRGKDNEI